MPPTVTRVPGVSPTVIQQRISTADFFDGSLPDVTTVTEAKGFYRFAEAATGGLFFWDINEPVVCSQFHASFGGAVNANLYIVNLDASDAPIAGEDLLIATGTGISLLGLNDVRIVLMDTQALKLVTTASVGAQVARVVGYTERAFNR